MHRALVAIGFLTLGTSSANAQRLDVKNGLWEITTNFDQMTLPQPVQDMMKKLPPEERAKMEPKSETSKTCLTEKDREDMFAPERGKNCKTTVVSKTSRRVEKAIACSGDPPAAGSQVVEAGNAESMRGTFALKSLQPDKFYNIKVTFTGRWLGSDCGSIESAGAPKAGKK